MPVASKKTFSSSGWRLVGPLLSAVRGGCGTYLRYTFLTGKHLKTTMYLLLPLVSTTGIEIWFQVRKEDLLPLPG